MAYFQQSFQHKQRPLDESDFEQAYQSNDRNIRGQLIKVDYQGNRIYNKPTKTIEDCFEIQTVSWTVEAIVEKTGQRLRIIFASGLRERQTRIDKVFDGDYLTFQ